MTPELLLSLAGLALIDSTSIGTLFIPVWLLLAPGPVNARRILGYLATIAAFYLAVGLLLVRGGSSLGDALGGALDNRGVLWAQLVLGVGMLALSFRYDGKRRPRTGGVLRWRDRATAGDSSARWLVGLALLAALAEVATMLPYLGAVGLLATSGVGAASVLGLLTGYCLVMVLPAVLLLGARVARPRLVEPVLARLNTWIVTKAGGALGWVLGIAGFLIARDAAARLDLFSLLDR
ncbi:Sap-like sulfolipid-1-addressing protein [Micromonospora violae]|uniref:Sap-like sulfolipid-1-addressing protein n=1 Tax=Micromonospora violae TaxID=1278207 RepID=A0A4Q7ULC9_9ACTN|nr:GAP family protein [Micromonospora violae]RZT81744.1 Sap-like sulfolipid-1-addressing protein [Micromonospora violae]